MADFVNNICGCCPHRKLLLSALNTESAVFFSEPKSVTTETPLQTPDPKEETDVNGENMINSAETVSVLILSKQPVYL